MQTPGVKWVVGQPTRELAGDLVGSGDRPAKPGGMTQHLNGQVEGGAAQKRYFVPLGDYPDLLLSTTLEPENRLVANELEARWNFCLQRIQELEEVVPSRSGEHRWQTSVETERSIRELSRMMPDGALAGLLNRLGKRTARGHTWTQARVCSFRINIKGLPISFNTYC